MAASLQVFLPRQHAYNADAITSDPAITSRTCGQPTHTTRLKRACVVCMTRAVVQPDMCFRGGRYFGAYSVDDNSWY